MAYAITPAAKHSPLTRHYADLSGVDFGSLPSAVAVNRSPDASNVYKNYRATNGQAIETRPGLASLGTVGGSLYGIHPFGAKCLLHYGTTLSEWLTFPSAMDSDGSDVSVKFITMAERNSVSFLFGGKLYLLDGSNYLVYDGSGISAVSGSATVPTTSIGADPDGGNRETYQEINLLSPYRKNAFVGNGSSTTYYLDATGLDASSYYTMQAWINGTLMTEGGGFTVNRTAGTVTFTTAPSAPATSGTDNVIIQFRKSVSGNAERIAKFECWISSSSSDRSE